MKEDRLETGKERCGVNEARNGLIRLWEQSLPGESRRLLARGARILTRIVMGDGAIHLTGELEELGAGLRELDSADEAARGSSRGAALVESLVTEQRELLVSHIVGKNCRAGPCFDLCARNVPPCQRSCPAGIDIPGFMTLTGHGRFQEAVALIARANPFPYVCGIICPAPCEKACLRNLFDQPVFIRPLKAVAARGALEQGGYPDPETAPLTGRRVAVVGSGPAGLSAAFFLARKGHTPVVFDGEARAGGMLRYGIPDFRLSKEILDREIAWIAAHGVTIHTNTRIEKINTLFDQGFDAVFLATGMPLSRKIPFQGNEQDHVLSGVNFLKQVNMEENPRVGPHVVVIGGGNVAVDVAMAALRQGGKFVHMVCLEKEEEMPASPHELDTARQEGIVVHNSWGPLAADQDRTFVSVFCQQVFDDQGRFSPVFDKNRTMTLTADHVIIAAGQTADVAFLKGEQDIAVSGRGIEVAPVSHSTGKKGVFAGGDVVTGPGIAVEAIGQGKEAALAIDQWLAKGKSPGENIVSNAGFPPPKPLLVSPDNRIKRKRIRVGENDPEDRKKNYQPVEHELDFTDALHEAGRCLRCDICMGCGLCLFVCSEIGVDAVEMVRCESGRFVVKGLDRISNHCISCGACAKVCPTGAVVVEQNETGRKTVFTGTVACENPLIFCPECGAPMMPKRYYDFIEARGCPGPYHEGSARLCSACRQRRTAKQKKKYVNRMKSS